MEQIIVIILFHRDHLLHKDKEERGKEHGPKKALGTIQLQIFIDWRQAWLVKL